MENPATWGEAEQVVNNALMRAFEGREAGMAGLSDVRQVTDALREAGLLAQHEEWLAGRGHRRIDAVNRAYGVLGLDYGKGHVDNLYAGAYDHGFRDAWALAERLISGRFAESLPGHLSLEYQVLFNKAKEEENQ